MIRIHPYIKSTNKGSYIFDVDTGLQQQIDSHDKEKGGYASLMRIMARNKESLKKHKQDKTGALTAGLEGYGDSNYLMLRIPAMLPSCTEILDATYFADREDSSYRKILFHNGIYDGITGMFFPARFYGFTPEIVFHNKVYQNYNEPTANNLKYMEMNLNRLKKIK